MPDLTGILIWEDDRVLPERVLVCCVISIKLLQYPSWRSVWRPQPSAQCTIETEGRVQKYKTKKCGIFHTWVDQNYGWWKKIIIGKTLSKKYYPYDLFWAELEWNVVFLAFFSNPSLYSYINLHSNPISNVRLRTRSSWMLFKLWSIINSKNMIFFRQICSE